MLSTPALAPLSLSYRLALIIESLCQAATVRCAQERSVRTLILVFRAWVRLRRLAVRFEALAAKVRAGRLVAPVVRLRAPPLPPQYRLPGRPQTYRLAADLSAAARVRLAAPAGAGDRRLWRAG